MRAQYLYEYYEATETEEEYRKRIKEGIGIFIKHYFNWSD